MQLRDALARAEGRWHGILVAAGYPQSLLNGKAQPCPWCGGKDRFVWDNKTNRGDFYCRHCGHGDGMDMLQRNGMSAKQAIAEIERLVGTINPTRPVVMNDHRDKLLKSIWSGSREIKEGDDAWEYLTSRGLVVPASPHLRFHSSMKHEDTTYPAMLARVVTTDNKAINIHRTFLKDGRKAPVESPKKLMPGKLEPGCAIRLFPPAERMGIAEGIETAIAASMKFGIPVWSAINSVMLAQWGPPEIAKHVVVFGDNDPGFAGQAAAYSLAKRLADTHEVEVMIPSRGDWADEQP